jgi:hypothetical protein
VNDAHGVEFAKVDPVSIWIPINCIWPTHRWISVMGETRLVLRVDRPGLARGWIGNSTNIGDQCFDV